MLCKAGPEGTEQRLDESSNLMEHVASQQFCREEKTNVCVCIFTASSSSELILLKWVDVTSDPSCHGNLYIPPHHFVHGQVFTGA